MSQRSKTIRSALFILFVGCSTTSSSLTTDHRYNVGDQIPFFVNKIGPLNNPSETYQYYDLPFCSPESIIEKRESLGEILNGDRLMSSLYALNFREDKARGTLCRKKLKRTEINKLRDAVINDFYFQMYYDDLPLWGYVGKIEQEKGPPKYYLFRHVRFDATYNGDRVIDIRAFGDPSDVLDISQDDAAAQVDVEFTYSVFWNATSEGFKTRMDKYLKASSLPVNQKIHWFSFVNSITIVLVLMGLLTVLFVRHLKNDLRKFSGGDEEDDREIGWKYIQGDVFRCPQNMSLFSAILGTGTQLLVLVCFLFVLVFLGVLSPYSRGALCSSLVFTYALTSVVSGYVAASFHCQFTEAGWEKSVRLCGFLYPGPLFATLLILNTVASFYGATAALPFGTFMVIISVYMLVSVPLFFFGGVIGYRSRSLFQPPCTTKRCPREIPSVDWYRKTPYQMFLAGFLSFSAIVLELRQLYMSMWSYKMHTVPSILFVMFVILLLLTTMLSIALTYIQLLMEDHQWWWRSVLCGGSTSIFMFGYSIYFYTTSNMSGFMQLSYFFGYTACMCYAFFIMLGSLSFRASWMFVRHIYRAVKSE